MKQTKTYIEMSSKCLNCFILMTGYHLLLSEVKDSFPRYGTMTGIRPTNPGFMMHGEKINEHDIRNHYIKNYMVCENAADLMLDVIGQEYKILGKYNEDKFAALYISIPFCNSVCSYCTFSAGCASEDTKARYIRLFIQKIKQAAQYFKSRKRAASAF